jgi:hypothetical protein
MVTDQRKSTPIARLTEMWRWRGPVRCAGLMVRYLMRSLVDWYVFYILETPIDPAKIRLPDANAPVTVKIHSLESGVENALADLTPILQLQPVNAGPRLRAGDSVAIAYHDGRAVGCSWFTARNLPMMWGLSWAVQPQEAVCFGSFVMPEWRGKRVHAILEGAINAQLHSQGIVQTCGSMSVLNPQTLSLAKQTNKRKRMTLLLVHLKGLDWHFHYSFGEPLEPRFHLQVDEGLLATENTLLPKPRRIVQ